MSRFDRFEFQSPPAPAPAFAGRWNEPRVGLGFVESMTMTPGAQAEELQRIDQDMQAFNHDLGANAVQHGMLPAAVVAGVGDWIDSAISWLTPGGPQVRAMTDAASQLAKPPHTNAEDPAVQMVQSTAAATMAATHAAATSKDRLVLFYVNTWLPFYKTWRSFFDAQKEGSWWHNPIADAQVYQAQLKQMRAKAISLGAKLDSPDPTDMHESSDWSKYIKIGVYGALGIGAIVALSSVVRAVRSK